VATVVVFAVSVLVDNSSIYDSYWGLQPLAVAGYYVWTGWGGDGSVGDGRLAARTAARAASARADRGDGPCILYALRLTSNFYRDWPGLVKEDFRYKSFRASTGRGYWPVSFVGIHLFPTIMVYLGCLPLYGMTRAGAARFGWLDGLGAAVMLGAIGLAFVADEQMRLFRRDPRNRGRIMQSGLWSRSRHPNYLGEVSTWWGLWAVRRRGGSGMVVDRRRGGRHQLAVRVRQRSHDGAAPACDARRVQRVPRSDPHAAAAPVGRATPFDRAAGAPVRHLRDYFLSQSLPTPAPWPPTPG